MKNTKPSTPLKTRSFGFFILVFFLSTITLKFSAQENSISNASIAEKIYLQLDKNIYTTGSTIWFKAIVTKAFDNAPTNLSSVLYVEFISSNETIIEKKLIKIDKGIGEGYFDLPETLGAGFYLIRAYTEWNKNFDTDFFFETYVVVFSITNETVKGTTLPTPEQKNTNKENHLNSTTSKNNAIDLQFFPESGELVNGLPSKVGFKVLDIYGNGRMIEGDIIDNEKNSVTSFKSNALGMGSFHLNSTDVNKTYYAKLKENDSLYDLPKVASMGNVLSVINKENTIILTGISNYMKSDSIYLNANIRGVNVYEYKSKLQNGTFRFSIPNNKLPEGIIVFTMLDNNKRKVAERLYFNKRLDTKLNIKISSDKSIYTKRDLLNLSIKTINKNDEPITANTSALVINKEQLGTMQHMRDNIVSYFLMSSELKGNIENPGFYFNNNTHTENHLDALMLTQGWRHYKYAKPFEKLTFTPETSLNVSGKVIIRNQKNENNEVDLTMMTYGKDEVLYMQTTDRLGNFYFDLDDEFGDDVKVLVAAKQLGKKVESNFLINEKKSPAVEFKIKKTEEKWSDISEVFVEKAIENTKIVNDFFISSQTIALDEVVLTGRKLSPIQQKVIDRFGEPDKIIEGKELQEKEKSWSSGIFDILHYNFSDKVLVRRDSVGNPTVHSLNGMATLVVIDGIPVFGNQYPNLRHIQSDQVTSIEVIEFAKTFKRFYGEVFPEKFGAKSPAQGNIVAIYTKAGKGIHGAYARKSKSLGETTIPVFAETKVFYAPKYDNTQNEDLKIPDLRSVIHWQPILKTDDLGIANTSFYNTDVAGNVLVIIEAITEDGAIGYQEFTYKVE